MRVVVCLALALLVACSDKDSDDDDGGGSDDTGSHSHSPDDIDGDGWANEDDCAPEDAAINPGADELCDGVDNDCDGAIDEDAAVDALTWCRDGDDDGWGDSEDAEQACSSPGSAYTEQCGDCDDSDPAFHPGADEDDCTDDTDYDCDGETPYADEDGDGWPECLDCDDGNDAVHPDADELCDGVDNDCDDLVDDEDDPLDPGWWYLDEDGDGYGVPGTSTLACDGGEGWAATDDDCDDSNADINPGATELCDPDDVDEDCDGLADSDDDSAATGTYGEWYADGDRDGYGDASASATLSCDDPSGPSGLYVANADDCDDGDSNINPDGTEVCDGGTGDGEGDDEDCDGLVDGEDDSIDEDSLLDWYPDDDGDGFGDDLATATGACEDPGDGWSSNASDCDDDDASVNPDAAEVCDDADTDEDCDGRADDDDPDVDLDGATAWYGDSDGDGYVAEDAAEAVTFCDDPGGDYQSTPGNDCDDGSDAIHPGADEICNDVDEDCDGDTDEGSGVSFVSSSTGDVTDYTSLLEAASDGSPAEIELSESGTVWLCEGHWYATFEADSRSSEVSFIGVGDPEEIIVDASDYGPVVDMYGPSSLTMSGFTVTGAVNRAADLGGGIYGWYVDEVVLEDMIITGNEAYNGGGLWLQYTETLTITGSTFSDNIADDNGGGAYLVVEQSIIEDTVFEGNSAEWGGGFMCNGGTTYGDMELTDVLVRDNSASEYGGGIFTFACNLDFTGTSSGSAGVTGNGVGGIFLGYSGSSARDSTLEATNVDFGESGTADDNDSYDLRANDSDSPIEYDDLGDGETISCTSTDGCD